MAYSSLGDFNKVLIISGALNVNNSNCSAKDTPSLIKLANKLMPSSLSLQESESHFDNTSLLVKLVLNSLKLIVCGILNPFINSFSTTLKFFFFWNKKLKYKWAFLINN